MALVAQPGLKGDAHGFWMHPGAAEAAQRLTVYLHKDPLQVAIPQQHKETTELTGLSMRQVSYLLAAKIGVYLSSLRQAGTTWSASFEVLVHT